MKVLDAGLSSADPWPAKDWREKMRDQRAFSRAGRFT
jgi:hypothetical protein